MDSSAEREESEDCRDTGIETREDFRMIRSEDGRVGGNIGLEDLGVGGRVDSIVCGGFESCRHGGISQMNMLQNIIEDRRTYLQSLSSEMCQFSCHSNFINRHSNFVHDSQSLSKCRGSDGHSERQHGHERRSKVVRF